MDVMAQTKRSAEDTIHFDANVKRFKEMARAPKEKKKNRRWRFSFQDFLISRDFGPYSVVKDVGSQKADITIGQLVAMVPSTQRELRKGLSTSKVPKVPTPLNAIAAKRECDPIIDVKCNGSVLCGMLVDGRAGVNVMIILTMRYLGLKIDRLASVTLKMANKRVVRPEGVISNVMFTVIRVSTIVDFHVVLEEDGAYPMISGKPWLTKSHARNYWGEGYMTIGVHPNRQKVPFASFVKSSRGTNEYEDEKNTDQSSSSKGIYMDDSSEEEVGLYALEIIPKVGALSDQRGQGDDKQSTPCVFTKGEVEEQLSKIQLGPDLQPEERKQYEDLLRKYIHLFAFNYKDLREVTMEQHKIELLPNAKPIRAKQGRWNPRYTTMVKEELDKLLEAGFIRPVKTTEWVSLVVLALKKNGKLRVCVNYKALNKGTKKDQYPLPFCEIFLEKVSGHEMYTFGDRYRGYHQVKIAPEDQLKTTFTTPSETFCYTVMPFGLCNAPGTFQRLMNKVFDPFLGLFLQVFIYNFGVYSDRVSHLAKLELIFQHLDSSGVTLNPKKITIGFSEGKMVGHIVSKDGVATDPEKLDRISKLPFPRDGGILLQVHTHVCSKSTSFNTILA